VKSLPESTIPMLVDLCLNDADEFLPVVQQERLVENDVRDFDEMTPDSQKEFTRLILNVACYSMASNESLVMIARQLALLSRKSFTATRKEMFLRACDVCAAFSNEAADELKARLALFEEWEGEGTDGERAIIADLRGRLIQ
jgi:hypothetical protein